jgi:hypothetical protein
MEKLTIEDTKSHVTLQSDLLVVATTKNVHKKKVMHCLVYF